MRKIGRVLILSILALSSCAPSELKLIEHDSYTKPPPVKDAKTNKVTNTPGVCAEKNGIKLTICQTDQKSVELGKAYFNTFNDPSWWDLPLIGTAGTAAGLLLFNATTDALKIAGLTAGVIGAGREYYSPNEVQTALLNGSNGYACLADAGRVVEDDQKAFSPIPGTTPNSNSVATSAATHLKKDMAKMTAPQRAKIKDKMDQANSALQSYEEQYNAAKYANNTMRSKARALGMGLLKHIQHKKISFSDWYQSLAKAAQATSKFQLLKSQTVTIKENASKKKDFAGSSVTPQTIANDTIDLLDALPNIQESISKFDSCVANNLNF